MRISILTLFPEMFTGFLTTSIIKRAISKEAVSLDVHDIRSYTTDKYHRVDDYSVGGGKGLIMKCQPVLDALAAIRTTDSHVILLSPRGETFHQAKAHALKKYQHIILICGHYEGVDERIHPYVDEEISIGDYILTGGELASMVISDAVIRLLEGAISEGSTTEESFEEGLLEYPQYTLPRVYDNKEIPPVLFSGNHEVIRKWRLKESLRITKLSRPDLLKGRKLSKEENKLLLELDHGEESPKWMVRAVDNAPQFKNMPKEEMDDAEKEANNP